MLGIVAVIISRLVPEGGFELARVGEASVLLQFHEESSMISSSQLVLSRVDGRVLKDVDCHRLCLICQACTAQCLITSCRRACACNQAVHRQYTSLAALWVTLSLERASCCSLQVATGKQVISYNWQAVVAAHACVLPGHCACA